MRKLKVFMNVLTLFAVLVSVVFISCGALFENGQNGNVSINLPPISSRARAIFSDKISDLKNTTTSYRITVNGMTREGTGGAFTFTLPVGVVAKITVECLNSSGNTIVRAKKTHTVTAGENNVDIILSRDGEMVGTSNTPTAPQPVRTVLYSDGKFIINELPQNRRSDVAVTKEYEAMVDDGSNYVFSSYSNVLWYDNRDSITSVEIGSNISPTSTAYWFYYMSNCTLMNLSNLATSNVTNMRSMFYTCSGLTSLDLSNFDTSNVTNMSWMFLDCSNLASLDLNHFDTTRVTDMSSMFSGCQRLSSLDLKNFNTEKVTNMSGMFFNCQSLSSLDLRSFNTQEVTDMSSMFRGCSAHLDLSSFNTANVTNMSQMFYDCQKNFSSLDLSSFNTSRVTDMSSMFYRCFQLTTIYASSSFVTDSVTTDATDMFDLCTQLVGGQNTAYSYNAGKDYARIDDPANGKPGYFTQKP